MILNFNTVIIGAGYAGVLSQRRLPEKSVIIERGFYHQNPGSYIVQTRNKYNFSGNEVITISRRISSGVKPFNEEYSMKLYHRNLNLNLFVKDSVEEVSGYEISNSILFSDVTMYGNIIITEIDISKKRLHGKILHLGKNVTINYNKLISTVPLHLFAKMAGLDLFKQFSIFISYYPIGVIKERAIAYSDTMKCDYYSDPKIPFYRVHQYKNDIFYEYCLNKKIDVRFHNIIIPGKFIEIPGNIMEGLYQFLYENNVFLIGRFAIWNPNFTLDHIYDPDTLSGPACEYIESAFGEK
jgi:hypothetical protein